MDMVRVVFSRPRLLIIFLVLACLNSCAKQAIIPPSTNDIIKYYQRLAVFPNGGWSKTDFSVSPDDYILILASGKISVRWRRYGQPPSGHLFMMIGKGGQSRLAVSPNNRRFFRSTETGRLALKVGDPMSLSFRRYYEAGGGFKVDIFVFSALDGERIFQALAVVAKANPADEGLGPHLKQIIGQQQALHAQVDVTEYQRTVVEDKVLSNAVIAGTKLQAIRTVEDNKRQSRTIFQVGHTAVVRSAAFSPNGKYVISGGDDNTLRLWEVWTGREVRVFEGHSDRVSSVAFGPEGKFVVSASHDQTLRLWEVTTGREVRSFEGHEGTVNSAAYSPDGKYVISGGEDKTVRLWEVSTGTEVRVLKRHDSSVNSVTFTRDGRYALSGSWDGVLQQWEVNTGKRIRAFKGHNLCINSVAFSPDGQFALSGSDDNTLQLWRTSDGKKLKIFEGHKYQVTSVAYSPDGKYGLSGSHDNTLRLWEMATGKEVRRFKGHMESIRSVAFSPNGRYALSSSNDESLRLWEVSTGREVMTFKGHRKSIRSVALSPDGKYALWGSDDDTLRLWEVTTGREVRSFTGHEGAVNSVAFSPNGKYVLSGGADKTLRLWEVSTGKETNVFQGHGSSISSVAFSPDGKYLLSGGGDDTLRLWDLSSGRQVRVFKAFLDPVRSVSFSPDGRFVLSTSNEGFRMWELSTGKKVKFTGGIVQELLGSVTSVAISPDGKHILCGTADNQILLWKLSAGGRARLFQRFLRGHTGSVNALTISPDGKYALSGSEDKTLRLWDLSSGSLVRVLVGHTDTVNSIAFSPDDKFAFSGGDDSSARLWSLESGEEVVSFHYSWDGEWMLTSPDGYYTCSPEGNSLLYWVYPEDMETFTFEQFEYRFKRPDIINARLNGNIEAGKPAPAMTKPPHIEMADHLAIKQTSAKSYSLTLRASAVEEVKMVRVFVNGKPKLEVPVNAKVKELSLDVPLFSGANRITALAYDEKGFSSNPRYVDVISEHTGLTKPNLYVFGIGVSDYHRLSSRWQLEFAHTDAQALVKAFLKQEGKLFGEVRYNLLSNEKATVETITDVFDALSATDENDLVVIFMAGHGVKAKDGTFYFLTSDGNFHEPQKGGISWTLLGEYLARIKGRVILLLDACHSGSIVTETVVPNDELAQQFFEGGRGGVMVFSASKGRQYSLESPDIGGGFGIFTYGLVQSLGPKAKVVDTNGNGFVEFIELVDSVSTYVNKETKGEQTPWLSRKELFGDLPVAVVN
jgi:WD40 repeat protein